MEISIKDAIDTLHDKKCSCVILKDNKLTVCDGPGISDLLRLLNTEPQILEGAFVADKVIGKAAAALLILGAVKEVYTDLISDAAVKLLSRTQVKLTFARQVPTILNRLKNDICPMEKLCADALSPKECYDRISKFIASKKQ